MAENFVKTLKRDYAKLANSPDSKTVMAQLQAWFDEYNSYQPHSALGYMPPTLFRKKQSENLTYRRYWVTGSRPTPKQRLATAA
jgi:putative transposase